MGRKKKSHHGTRGHDLQVTEADVRVGFFFHVGSRIDLERVVALSPHELRTRPLGAGRAQPGLWRFSTPPLVCRLQVPERLFSGFPCQETEVVYYELGVLVVYLLIPCSGGLEQLVRQAEALYEDKAMAQYAEEVAQEACSSIHEATQDPACKRHGLTYRLYCIRDLRSPCATAWIDETFADPVARWLRATGELLSEEEVEDALSGRAAYTEQDLALIDHDAAIFFHGPQVELRQLIEACAVQVVKLQWISQEIDQTVQLGINLFKRRPTGLPFAPINTTELQQLDPYSGTATQALLRTEDLFVLQGGRYLQRIHDIVREKFRLEERCGELDEKLEFLGQMYQHLHDVKALKSQELLEWLIILLIFISVCASFLL